MHHCVSKDKGNFFWNYPKLWTQKILPWHIDYAIYRQLSLLIVINWWPSSVKLSWQSTQPGAYMCHCLTSNLDKTVAGQVANTKSQLAGWPFANTKSQLADWSCCQQWSQVADNSGHLTNNEVKSWNSELWKYVYLFGKLTIIVGELTSLSATCAVSQLTYWQVGMSMTWYIGKSLWSDEMARYWQFDCCRKYRSKFTTEETVMFCLRVMVGVIILYDHVHPIGAFAKSSPIDVSTTLKRVVKEFWWKAASRAAPEKCPVTWETQVAT